MRHFVWISHNRCHDRLAASAYSAGSVSGHHAQEEGTRWVLRILRVWQGIAWRGGCVWDVGRHLFS